MVKAFVTSALALATLFGGLALACSSSSDSTFGGDPPKPDAEDGPISNLVPDGGGPADGAKEAASSCTATTPSPFTPVWQAPVRAPAACSTQELTDYYTACLVNAGTTEKDGTCATWKTDHPTCGACTEPVDQSGPIQWHVNRYYYTLNVAGCIALEQDGTDAGAAGCGEAYNAAIDCERQSCVTCLTEANSFSLFSACETQQKTSGCQTYETAKTTACGTYAGAADCFPKGAEPTELQGTGISLSFYTRVIGVTCGP